jgi:formylglycine-generating enzyme required for sulfatase activity
MSDLDEQLARLRAQRDAATDSVIRDALNAAIAAFEASVREPAIEHRNGQGRHSDSAAQAYQATIQDQAQVGASVAGNVGDSVVAPLFPAGGSGNYIAGVINLYGQASPVIQSDYTAALQRYLEHLYACHSTIDLRGIDNRPMDVPLSELYISLNLHEPRPQDLRGADGLRQFVERVGNRARAGELAHSNQVSGHETFARRVSWMEALRHARVVIVGAPGSGKTTLLHYTALRLAEVLARDDDRKLLELGLVQTPPVPVLVPIRELGVWLQESGQRELSGANPRLLLDCIANYYGRFELDLPANFFSRLCESGRAILLLDGLDEVADAEDRIFVSSIVRTFVTRYPHCRYAITARLEGYQGDAQIGLDFRVCTVDNLDAEQQRRFISNWSRSVHALLYDTDPRQLELEAHRYTEKLWSALQADKRARDLATNPLLLTVIAVVFYNNSALPKNRAALYESCIEALLRGGRGKADRAGQELMNSSGTKSMRIGLSAKRALLAAIAYEMHARGEEGLFIGRTELIQLVAEQLGRHVAAPTHIEEAAQAFVDELPVHTGLLDEREPDRFRFSHLSFQEFLAARHLGDTDRWDELLVHYREAWWREVILLCIGYLKHERRRRFLERLITQGATPNARSAALMLGTSGLAELEAFKGDTRLHEQIATQALAILETPIEAVPVLGRVRCGRVLARLGDPRPGVCTLPPILVRLEGGRFRIGSTREEAERAYEGYRQEYSEELARSWSDSEISDTPVDIPSFELGRYPVTNAQYSLFIADGGYAPDRPWWDEQGHAWLLRDDNTNQGLERWVQRQHKNQPELWDNPEFGEQWSNHPVVGISLYEAQAFCRWLTQQRSYNPEGYHFRLPSEFEWEYAARGAERRVYPWGPEEAAFDSANFGGAYSGTTAVGCFAPSATAGDIFDLAGNVWEWTGSIYQPYQHMTSTQAREPDSGGKLVTIRGGCWNDQLIFLRAAYRYGVAPDYHYHDVGFRVARVLE